MDVFGTKTLNDYFNLKAFLIFCCILLPVLGEAQSFVFFDSDLKQVKEKKAVYYSRNRLSGKGREYLVLKPAPNSGMDTVLVAFYNGKLKKSFPFEWLDVPVSDSMPTQNQELGSRKGYLLKDLQQADGGKPDQSEELVFVRFTVTEKGEVTNIQVLKNTHPALAAEAVRRIRESGREGWVPASLKGKPVALNLMMPVVFKLNPQEE